MGNLKDYATGIVVTAPSPADSGTSLVLQAGEGARMPATPFYATAHPPTEMPTLDNAEKIQVTNVSTDTLTIVRAQGSTTAQDIEPGWRITNSLFLADIPDTFDDLTDGSTNKAFTSTLKTKLDGIEAAADVTDATNVAAAGAVMEADTSTASMSFVVDEDNMSSNSATKLATQQSIKAYVDAAIAAAKSALYPVGSYYTNETDSTNPGTLLGFGTWTAVTGKVVVGKAASGTFGTAGATGGAETHTLSTGEIPSHSHALPYRWYSPDVNNGTAAGGGSAVWGALSNNTSSAGGGGAHNNLQPYIVAYMWKRTA